MIYAVAALPSLSVAVQVWVAIVGFSALISIVLAGLSIGYDEPNWRAAIAVLVAFVLVVTLASAAILLSHHAAWVDYRRQHPQVQQ